MTRDPRRWRALLQVATVAAMPLWAESAAARDEALEPEPEAAITPEPDAPAGAPAGFDTGFGGALTTDYVSRGITLSDSRPAIQGYVEASYGLLYANVWSSNVDFGEDFRGAEIDVTGGLRPKFGPLSLNLGYAQYLYAPEEVSPTYGEVFAKADYNVTFVVGMHLFFAPDFSQTGKTATFIAGGAKVLRTKNFSFYGGLGYQFFEDPHEFEDLTWSAGLSYTWKALTFDVRYWDTNLSDSQCLVRSGFEDGCGARIVGTISLDLTWSKLTGRGS
jgi:uncharacterized protein (TIGR02001 family)